MHRYSVPLLIIAAGLLVFLSIGAFVSLPIVAELAIRGGAYVHGIGLGLITFLVVLALPRSWLPWAGIVVLATGAVELVQPLFGRASQWPDFLAGVAGLVVGALAAGALLFAIRARKGRGR